MLFLKSSVRTIIIITTLSVIVISCGVKKGNETALNTLSEEEKAGGWRLLFDGRTTDGWRKFNADKIGGAWKVKDGALALDASHKDGWQTQDGGDIVTQDEFENYELNLEWKIDTCGNSGIIFN